jgi:hypothetical protein
VLSQNIDNSGINFFKLPYKYSLSLIFLAVLYVAAPIVLSISIIFIVIFLSVSKVFYESYLPLALQTNFLRGFTTFNQSFSTKGIDLPPLFNFECQLNFFLKNLETLGISSFLTNFDKILTNYLNYPIFIYTGLFFFLTTFISLVVLNYLGLYGVFILNLISLSIL